MVEQLKACPGEGGSILVAHQGVAEINDSGGRSSAFRSLRGSSLRSQSGACGSNLEAHTLRLLQIGNDLKQIAGSRIPVRAKHLVKGLNVNLGMRGQLEKADCGIDVITQ
jgi:hypothetical protein